MQRFLHVRIGTFLHQYIKYTVGKTFFFIIFQIKYCGGLKI